MRNNLENRSATLYSADSPESADSSGRNHVSKPYSPIHFSQNQKQKQAEIELTEKVLADEELERKLSLVDDIFGENVDSDEIDFGKIGHKVIEKSTDTKEKIAIFKEGLESEGKSSEEILKMLIAHFENEEAVQVWVKNWKQFLKLHEFAKTKPPEERKALEGIISNADFSASDSFDLTLRKIEKSELLSAETKFEIAQKFDGSKVFSVDRMDRNLKHLKKRKKEAAKELLKKKKTQIALNKEIEILEKKIKSLPPDSGERKELETKLETKKAQNEAQSNTIQELKAIENQAITFELREGFFAKENPDGSRCIVIDDMAFEIKLPTNRIFFMGRKNLRSLNLVFPFRALQKQNVAKYFFRPKLKSKSIPNKEQRNMSHLILSSLGLNDDVILSEENIAQMENDFRVLTTFMPAKSPKECFEALSILDTETGTLDKVKLKDVLGFMKENRGITEDLQKSKIAKIFID